jgi:uncharacterized protein (DUF2147 family)
VRVPNRIRLALIPAVALLLCAPCLSAAEPEPTPTGLWKTIDDKTGKPRGTVRIFARDGEFFGKIESSLDPKDATEVCDKCSDDRKDKPIIGLVIMRRMKKKGDEYSGGDILDPDTGTVYRCKFRILEGGKKLSLRGYVGISLLGRSQIWIRE